METEPISEAPAEDVSRLHQEVVEEALNAAAALTEHDRISRDLDNRRLAEARFQQMQLGSSQEATASGSRSLPVPPGFLPVIGTNLVQSRPIVLEQSPVQHIDLQPVADPTLMASLAAWHEKLSKETKEVHAQSFADLVSIRKRHKPTFWQLSSQQ